MLAYIYLSNALPVISGGWAKRVILETELLFAILCPPYGMTKSAKETQKMAAMRERIANETTDGLVKVAINDEMVAVRMVVLQSQAALEWNVGF